MKLPLASRLIGESVPRGRFLPDHRWVVSNRRSLPLVNVETLTMAKFVPKTVTGWLSLLLSLIFVTAWVLAVASVGQMDHDCDTGDGCRALFRPIWWSLIFELAVYGFLFVAWLVGVVDKVRPVLIAFLVLTAVNTEDEAEEALRNREDDGIQGNLQTGILATIRGVTIEHNNARATATGFILLTFCNFMFILILGCEDLIADVKLPSVSLKRLTTPFKKSDKDAEAGQEGGGEAVESHPVEK